MKEESKTLVVKRVPTEFTDDKFKEILEGVHCRLQVAGCGLQNAGCGLQDGLHLIIESRPHFLTDFS